MNDQRMDQAWKRSSTAGAGTAGMDRGINSGRQEQPCTCRVASAATLIFVTRNFDLREGQRWVWLDGNSYNIDQGCSNDTEKDEPQSDPQKVTIPMSGLVLGDPHNLTVALVDLAGLVLASDSLVFVV